MTPFSYPTLGSPAHGSPWRRWGTLPLCCTPQEGKRKWRITFAEYLPSLKLWGRSMRPVRQIIFSPFSWGGNAFEESWMTCPRSSSPCCSVKIQIQASPPKPLFSEEGGLVLIRPILLKGAATSQEQSSLIPDCGDQSAADSSARQHLEQIIKMKSFCSGRGSKSCHTVLRQGGGQP